MSKRNSTLAICAKALVPLAMLAVLAGCDVTAGSDDDIYMPTASYERYPIEVVKGKAKLDVKPHGSKLTREQEDTVARFAQAAQSNAISAVNVRRPSGGGRGSVIAQEITAVLKRNGVDGGMITHGTYSAGASAPVLISYTRKYAVTKECGDWSKDFASSGANDPYPNFGCASQNNLAAMVSNPADLESPRAMGPADSARRGVVLEKYRTGETTVTQIDDKQQTIAVSTVAAQ